MMIHKRAPWPRNVAKRRRRSWSPVGKTRAKISEFVEWVLIEPQTNSWLQRRHVFLLDVVSGLGLA